MVFGFDNDNFFKKKLQDLCYSNGYKLKMLPPFFLKVTNKTLQSNDGYYQQTI